MEETKEPLWDWTLRRIRRIWPLGDPTKLQHAVAPDLPDSDLQLLRDIIDACLESRGGKVSARARAAELGETYMVLNSSGRHRFLELLANEYDVDNDAVDQVIAERHEATDPFQHWKLTLKLRNILEPPRSKLLSQFNDLEEGVKFLVDLRAELISWARKNPPLKALDRDVFRLLESWFDIGFLDLRRITWNSSAALLEKFIEYEAVHAIRSWDDLRNRLKDDRRCYAYFHPRMPDEPLIFVEIALVKGISSNIHALLDEEAPDYDPEKADTAIFYSISNCQSGLAGVSFGNFLIKRVVGDLASTLPNIKTFCTLSPLPGFMKWLRSNIDDIALNDDESSIVEKILQPDFPLDSLRNLISNSGDDSDNSALLLKSTLVRLCSWYLLNAKKNGRAYDPVAHFHLTNGAQVERINWAANLSSNGLLQSAGLMVNYLYNLPNIEKNHEAYQGQDEVTASSTIRKNQAAAKKRVALTRQTVND
ncbi:MAG: malonyl-CoA decarboxylase [Deltaproteobacteria bacterium]|nr:malonyl-CoA decarboxylase [Deltaproteobacteria bacterium]